jgi:hypothetical protein
MPAPLREESRIRSPLALQQLFRRLGERLVLTVNEADRPSANRRIQVIFQRGSRVPGNAVSRAGEDLEEGDTRVPEGVDIRDPRPGMRGQGVVDLGTALQVLALLGQVFHGAHRSAVRVFDDRGHPGGCCRGRTRREILAIGAARIHQVHVRVHATRHHQQPRGVDRARGGQAPGVDASDDSTIDGDVRTDTTRRGHNRAAGHNQFTIWHAALLRNSGGLRRWQTSRIPRRSN